MVLVALSACFIIFYLFYYFLLVLLVFTSFISIFKTILLTELCLNQCLGAAVLITLLVKVPKKPIRTDIIHFRTFFLFSYTNCVSKIILFSVKFTFFLFVLFVIIHSSGSFRYLLYFFVLSHEKNCNKNFPFSIFIFI